MGLFLFGAACSQLTTDIAKYSIGRLRPHFISVSWVWNIEAFGLSHCYLKRDWDMRIHIHLIIALMNVFIKQTRLQNYRNDWFQLCNPQFYDGTNCNSPTRQYRYNEDYQCLNPEATGEMGRQMRLSFPSGHSSFVFYTMVFCTVSWSLLRIQFSIINRFSNSNSFICSLDSIGEDQNYSSTCYSSHS